MEEPWVVRGSFPQGAREKFLELVIQGWPLADAAVEVGVNPLTITRTARSDPYFAADLIDALELSTSNLEALLAEIAATKSANAIARVNALKVLLEGRSARYKHFQAPDPALNKISTSFQNYPQLDT